MRNRKTPKLPTEERLSRAALHYLERYASSSTNLRRVLERRVLKASHFHERDPSEFSELIELVVSKCIRSGLVNDKTYAETKTAGMRRRGASKRKIEAHLSAKGVDRDTIRNVLQDEDDNEINTAIVFAKRRRLGPFRNEQTRDERTEKDKAAMCRAGFSFEIARRVIESNIGDLDDLADDTN